MANQSVLPGNLVVIVEPQSIYRGYKGIVQRISGQKAAVLFEGGCWDKLITLPINSLKVSH